MQYRGSSTRWLALSAGVALAACGGAADSALFDSNGGFVAQGDGGSSTFPGSGSGSGSDAASGSGSGSGGNPSGSGSGGHPDASVPTPPVDSGTSSGADSSSGVDSALPPPTNVGIPCGKKTCDPTNGKVCCVDPSGNNAPTCDSTDGCNQNGGLSVVCAKAADCVAAGSPADSVCCVTQGQNGSPATVACVAAGQCSDPGTQAWMCDPGASNACPSGDVCKPSSVTIPPYSICVKGP